MCVFSHILYFFMDSFRSTRWPCHILYSTVGNLSVFLTFLCRLCVRFLIYVMFVLFSVRISVRLFCVLSTCIVFFSMTKPVLLFLFMSGSSLSDLWPPRIFWPFLSCFTSSCVVSVRISVRLFCVPFKGKKIRWPSLSFFPSCPAPVFPIYAPPPPTPSVPFHLYMRGWGREGSGRAMAHGWLRLVLWCS